MPYFGTRSKEKRAECIVPLIRVLNTGILAYDFSVVCGHRNEIEQQVAFTRGTSKVRWPFGKHNKRPAEAFDIYPYHKKYAMLIGHESQIHEIAEAELLTLMEAQNFILQEFCIMAGTIKMAARAENVILRWGGDWDRDGDRLDQKFNDLGHFEYIGLHTEET